MEFLFDVALWGKAGRGVQRKKRERNENDLGT